ncbi:hypothetical protein BpHYR1_009789 [Brachionus plicatilis]|uniref:Uncharacterized protein n=1 Tax=Brachionus plicatilis TaxID=10195 RepID=A0A3M7P2M3_BRAPC|nr:hypothetical protein BpHYR1_009789 [Brachionus plicatilis]
MDKYLVVHRISVNSHKVFELPNINNGQVESQLSISAVALPTIIYLILYLAFRSNRFQSYNENKAGPDLLRSLRSLLRSLAKNTDPCSITIEILRTKKKTRTKFITKKINKFQTKLVKSVVA